MSDESGRSRRAADSHRPRDFTSAAAGLDRPTYENLKRALELGRWPDGRTLEPRQREICLDAVLSWEAVNLPPEQRSGYIERGACASAGDREGTTAPDRIRILGDE